MPYIKCNHERMVLLNFDFLDKIKYKDVPILKMIDNNNGGLPFYIRRYIIPSFIPINTYSSETLFLKTSGLF